ncbi:uncharacterized protein LOC129941052 [Eupeodes corollae]|uniref:uncharacterized protein LOC129941052 n=1 Tax=Eupeodes corollae TaxID=290404 RepID=UPI002492B3F9|nr:uncharacterized protein LOC129941052 [Eupeodes corollae]
MPFLYGQADEKFIKLDIDSSTQKLKPLDSYKFHLNTQLEGHQKIKPDEVSIRLKTSPDTLVEICLTMLDAIPLPYPFYWNTLEVANWIRKLGFPQYQNTFKKNLINGRSLLRLDASYLEKLNIKDFNHMKIIMNAIRSLYGFEKSSFKRSISLPHRNLESLYKFYKTKTGPNYEKNRLSDVGRIYHVIRPRPLYETHWQILEKCLQHTDPKETECIGDPTRNKNKMYTPKKGESPTVCHSPKKTQRECSGIPPCMCNWTQEVDLRQPWQLKCLGKEKKNRHKMETHECNLQVCSLCDLHKGLTVLQKYIPDKYGTTFL